MLVMDVEVLNVRSSECSTKEMQAHVTMASNSMEVFELYIRGR